MTSSSGSSDPRSLDPRSLDPRSLGMSAHPEGGWYRETWRSERTVMTPRGERRLATSIAFLLQPGEQSAWHRVRSDELWLWQGGGELELHLGGAGEEPTAESIVRLGLGSQQLIPAETWQRARPGGDEAVLVACVVAPGFDFADFDLED